MGTYNVIDKIRMRQSLWMEIGQFRSRKKLELARIRVREKAILVSIYSKHILRVVSKIFFGRHSFREIFIKI